MAEGKERSKKSECVKVMIRCRPMSTKEKEKNFEQIIHMDSSIGRVSIANAKDKSTESHAFTFDGVYDPNSKQKNIYDETAFPIVESVLEGYNGTIFAYGQTGTGKTFTMVGADDGTAENDLRGIIPRAFQHIFDAITATPERTFLVRVSFLEIYNEEIRDLLGRDHKARLDLKDRPDGGVYVKDLSAFTVRSVREMEKLMAMGQKNRSVAATQMNQESSRSHSLFTVTIESATVIAGKTTVCVGKLNMVDLAGSERQSKTGATGDQLKEATKINLSLSALGNVISALVDGKSSYIPYRDSKLTRLLQDSLGGNTKTCMIANIGPTDYNYDETMCTLRYANRAKNIKNKPRINEDPKDTMIREFQEEIARLQAQLQTNGGIPGVGGKVSEEELRLQQEKIERDLHKKFENERKKIEEDKEKTEAEKERLYQELQNKEAEQERQKAEKEALKHRLKDLEAQMVHGNEALAEAQKQKRELKKAHLELAEKKRKEAEAEAQRREDLALRQELEASCNNKDEVIQKLHAKLSKMTKRVSELEDQASILQDTNRDMLSSMWDRDRDSKLKDLIIEHFIPPNELSRLLERANWDSSRENWVISHLQLSGRSLREMKPKSTFAGAVRPISTFSCDNMGEELHLRQSNLQQPQIDEANRTTMDFDPYNSRLPDTVRESIECAINGSGTTLRIPETQPQVYYAYMEGGGLCRAPPEPTVGIHGAAYLAEQSRLPSNRNRPVSAARQGR